MSTRAHYLGAALCALAVVLMSAAAHGRPGMGVLALISLAAGLALLDVFGNGPRGRA